MTSPKRHSFVREHHHLSFSHEGKAAISIHYVAIVENIGGIRPRDIISRYKTIFRDIISDMRVHRNDLAHDFYHAKKEQDIQWRLVWRSIQHELQSWNTR